MTLRELYTKAKSLLDMGHSPESIVLVKPRELGGLFEVHEVTNLAPGIAPTRHDKDRRVVLVEFRAHKDSPHNENEVQRLH